VSIIAALGSRHPERYRKLVSWKKLTCRSSGLFAANSSITPSSDFRNSARRALYSSGVVPSASSGPSAAIIIRRMGFGCRIEAFATRGMLKAR